MDSKLHILKLKIQMYSKLGKIGRLASKIKISSKGNTVKNILVCFPIDEPSFRVASFSFRKLKEDVLKDVHIILLIPSQYKNLIKFYFGQIITYDMKNEKNISSTLEEIRKIINDFTFDMIIDLNPNFSFPISHFISNIPANYKVGFQSVFSDTFYNIQFELSTTGFLERGYNQINSLITSK